LEILPPVCDVIGLFPIGQRRALFFLFGMICLLAQNISLNATQWRREVGGTALFFRTDLQGGTA
jgi:hypothetical protein